MLRSLHRWHLAGVDDPAPDNALRKTGGSIGGVHQLGDKFVVRHVFGESGEEPGTDLLCAALDVASTAIVVTQGVVPKSEPMFGVTLVVCEQAANKPGPFVGFVVLEERVQFFGRWEQANDVEVNAPSKNGIRNGLRRLDMIRAKISLENRIDRIFVRPKLNCWFTWSETSGLLSSETNFQTPLST